MVGEKGNSIKTAVGVSWESRNEKLIKNLFYEDSGMIIKNSKDSIEGKLLNGKKS